MKAAALDLATIGLSVFPVGMDGRSPLVKRGCYAASSDTAQIADWWSRWPRANIALGCGPASGVLALDIDRHGDIEGPAALAELEAEFGRLPTTVQSATPSGGTHLLFLNPPGPPPQNRVGLKRYGADGSRRVYHGLDVRAKGASICLPPSRKASGGYAWVRSPFVTRLAPLPGWLLSLMLSEPPPREPSEPLQLDGSPERVARYVCAAIDGECGELARMKPGSGRNQRLFIAAARLGSLVGADVLRQTVAEEVLERAAADCGLIAEDGLRAVLLTIASGLKRGIETPRRVAA